jgi:hypothetical protein
MQQKQMCMQPERKGPGSKASGHRLQAAVAFIEKKTVCIKKKGGGKTMNGSFLFPLA